ncbi:Rossmann-fold NAD(P)-binding domain-containing protein [Flindersiella endophytica]
MYKDLEGKTALVIGGSRGIGRACVERLAAHGAAVAVSYVQSTAAANELVQAVEADGGNAVALQADVSELGEVRALFEEAEAALGRLDIVVVNAGVAVTKPMLESTEEDYDYVFDTNTKGAYFALQEAARRVSDGGRIIAISTGATKMWFTNMSLYLGSKAAVEQFVRGLSREVGHRRITVNAVSPGYTNTDMLPADYKAVAAEQSPFERVGEPEEVADGIVFLATDAARWITGQNLGVGGGVS